LVTAFLVTAFFTAFFVDFFLVVVGIVRVVRACGAADSACGTARAKGHFSFSHGGTEAQRREVK
jgi:hypothetical protein